MVSNIRLAKVVGVHPEKHTVDLIFLDTGGPFMDAYVATDDATSNSGTMDLPDPTLLPINTEPRISTGRDMIAVVLMIGRQACVVAFIPPQYSQMFFKDHNRRVQRHASDVYTSTDAEGNFEFYHPSGSFIRLGATSAHEDLTGKDARGLWKIANNTGAAPYLNIEVANAGAVVSTVLFDPAGNLTITGNGNLSSTFQGTQLLNSHGDATLSSTTGKVHVTAGSDVDITAAGNLNSSAVNMTLGATGNGSVTASGTLLLSSGSTATLSGTTEVMIQAPLIDLSGAVTVTGLLTTAAIAATAVTIGGTPVLLSTQQAADSAKLGGLPAADYATTSALGGYLLLTGGHLSGAPVLNNAVSLQGLTTGGAAESLAEVDASNNAQLGNTAIPTILNTSNSGYLQINTGRGLKKAVAWRDGCLAMQSSGTTLPNATWTALLFGSESYDDNGYHSTVSQTSRITPGVNGSGRFSFTAGFLTHTVGMRGVELRKNGSGGPPLPTVFVDAVTDTGNPTYLSGGTGIVQFTSTDYFEVYLFQDSGASLSSASGSTYFDFAMVEYT